MPSIPRSAIRCVGAKVNGKLVPLRTQLVNGDQVEVVTSKAQTPSPTWERFVVTGKARARIRRFVRTQQRQQYLDLGKAILQKAFRQEGHELIEKALGERPAPHSIAERPRIFTSRSARGCIPVARSSMRFIRPRPTRRVGKVVPLAPARGKKAAHNAVPIRGLIPGMALHYAGCCHPLPGDRIVGIVTPARASPFTPSIARPWPLLPRRPSAGSTSPGTRTPSSGAHVGRIEVTLGNEPGSLGSLTTVIGKGGGNITNLKITNRSLDFFEILVDVEVQNVRHLTNIIAALRATPVINSVERARG